jgi:outer membrane protein assembly factor BamD
VSSPAIGAFALPCHGALWINGQNCWAGAGTGRTAILDLLILSHYRCGMSLRSVRPLLILLILVAFPFRSPAPFIYTPGEGWSYEPVGGEGKWRQPRAKDQLEVAEAAFEKQAYGTALKAARRVTKVWPLSDYAPQAQYLVGRCYEARGQDERAFKAYQQVLTRYPKIPQYEEILSRQYAIADRFLAGQWFKFLGYVPVFPSMTRTAEMYGNVVKNGPFSEVAPEAQLKIGSAHEKQRTMGFKTPDYPGAAKAYETAADRYHDRPQIAAEALYREGLAHRKQAQSAEYDQTSAGRAIARFTDFLTLYPDDPRAREADRMIGELRREQARGNFEIARFYESKKKWTGALVYYNEVMLRDPESNYAKLARERIDILKQRVLQASN